jgi:hypothetical protein
MSVDQVSASGRMVITCLEGACRLSNPASGVATDLTAGQQTEMPGPGQDPLPARPMERAQFEDWRDNFPEAIAVAQQFLDQLQEEATPTPPPPPSGFNVSGSGAASTPRLALDASGALHRTGSGRRRKI